MNILKSVKAWLSGLFTKKVEPMFDADGILIADPVAVALPSEVGAQPAIIVQPVPAVAAEPVTTIPAHDAFIEKFEKALSAMGHEFPIYWAEAIALAKKAI